MNWNPFDILCASFFVWFESIPVIWIIRNPYGNAFFCSAFFKDNFCRYWINQHHNSLMYRYCSLLNTIIMGTFNLFFLFFFLFLPCLFVSSKFYIDCVQSIWYNFIESKYSCSLCVYCMPMLCTWCMQSYLLTGIQILLSRLYKFQLLFLFILVAVLFVQFIISAFFFIVVAIVVVDVLECNNIQIVLRNTMLDMVRICIFFNTHIFKFMIRY